MIRVPLLATALVAVFGVPSALAQTTPAGGPLAAPAALQNEIARDKNRRRAGESGAESRSDSRGDGEPCRRP